MSDVAQAVNDAVYPFKFFAMRYGWRWWAVSEGPDYAIRKEIGPFWRWRNAARAADALTKNFRTGRDLGHEAGLRCARPRSANRDSQCSE